ncbi:MAG: hypothetical protein M0Z27_04215 [Thermaerobacter sp.]|nr:hypothetical protein [Thermaerobacter sp.]
MRVRAVTDEEARTVRDKVARLRKEGRELTYRDFTLDELEVLRELRRREAESALAAAEEQLPGRFGETPERMAAIFTQRQYRELSEDIARKRADLGLPPEDDEGKD